MHAADDFLDPFLKDRGHLWLTLAGLSAHPASIKPNAAFLARSLSGKWERVIRHSLMKNLIRAIKRTFSIFPWLRVIFVSALHDLLTVAVGHSVS
ncbi:hypothetical protein AVEN_215262-1 [Araneus ventricosus]|uniref:Uncharacterized protein n=1 Tax=Araneus ventricosus TaxID=182803 RepID=A0A4Y1ZKP9_ARAVE|nr:hypothetical protein AVEN_264579-1 [Araneus ventricosus]GBL54868.1 hypothetical protein AVEN_116295-1 [Araneus ventricosus]GBL55019.1 hypothetical protein AVEN_35784-1 [Araneus ventricosus]GBL55161.1 hypothetical protein AVEN_215262-1 [Araneus ventricosus]